MLESVCNLLRPAELLAMMKYKLMQPSQKSDKTRCTSDEKRCYEFLSLTSRSFAAVIQALDVELRHAVCIFYLVLRALDTVEDDMSIPSHRKVPMLRAFYRNLYDPEWKFMESTEKDKVVLEEFPVISREFRQLAPAYRRVISDICKRMGEGMEVYLDKAPDTLKEWDEYCHYVAGLVGIGLSQLFSASGLETQNIGQSKRLSNSMGLFLQKTNIIRDYLEDVQVGREFWPKQKTIIIWDYLEDVQVGRKFWPKQVWGKYCDTLPEFQSQSALPDAVRCLNELVWGKYCDSLPELQSPSALPDAVRCLNELVTNALAHVPDCMAYLEQIQNSTVFSFCAIPQVMAIATLERCYNNPHVFSGVVKIRKGEAVRLMLEVTDIHRVKAVFKHYLNKIQERIPSSDPDAQETRNAVTHGLTVCHTSQTYTSCPPELPLYMSCGVLASGLLWTYWADFVAVCAMFSV